jgi:hypothetical protein
MTLRKPLVVGADGRPQQLQSGDVLDTPQSGGDISVLVNAEASPIVIGTPVFAHTVADNVKKAKANASGTKDVIGLVRSASIAASSSGEIITSGVLLATIGQWDTVTGQSGGLTIGALYFLDPATSGMLTTTPPTTVGQYVAPVMRALSTTEGLLAIDTPILL